MLKTTTFYRDRCSFTLKGVSKGLAWVNWGVEGKKRQYGCGGGEATLGYPAQTGLLFPFLKYNCFEYHPYSLFPNRLSEFE